MKVIIAKYILIIISSIFYVIVGIKHFIDPQFFLAIVPPYLPLPPRIGLHQWFI